MTFQTAVRLSRPFTLLPPLLGILSGAVCAFGSAHNPDPERRLTLSVLLVVAVGSLCASLLNAASNVLNQVTDLEVDRVNNVPTWWVVVPPVEGFLARALSPLGTHECFFLFAGGLLFTLVYSLPSFGRTKARGIWANVTIAIPRGCLLKVAGWTMVASSRTLEPWAIGALFGLFLMGASTTKDFSDVEGDRAGGCRTLPVLYGNRKAVAIISPFFVLPWLLLIPLAFCPDPADPAQRLLTGNSTVLALLGALLTGWGAYTVRLLARNPEELSATENHPSWRHMYLMLMAAQVGFAVAYVV
ncbi:MAG: hypothetical protein DYH06_22985 [Acidobacteria bacterium ACB2]|nr:hypothetical protein [Acidobacteria bacterium ACB2]